MAALAACLQDRTGELVLLYSVVSVSGEDGFGWDMGTCS